MGPNFLFPASEQDLEWVQKSRRVGVWDVCDDRMNLIASSHQAFRG